MNQRTERLAAEIQSVLGSIISRGEIRDSRVRDAGLVTITAVRVTGDLREAHVSFAVFGADDAALEKVRKGLEAARVFLQQELGRRLRARNTALLSFHVDRGLDNAFRVDTLLREAAVSSAAASSAAAAATPEVSTDTDGDDDDSDDTDSK